MDSMMAQAEIARRYEVVSDGAHTARLLVGLITKAVRTCVARLSQSIGEQLALLQLGEEPYEPRVAGAGD
jgi:hypothetical protein